MNDPWDWRPLTPAEQAPSGRVYKREDKYAPMGYGSINGSKLRQLDYLIGGAAAAGARAS